MDITIIHTVLDQYSIKSSDVELVRESSDNLLYKITSLSRRFALRIAKRAKSQSIHFEAQLVARLMDQQVCTPRWIQTTSGDLYVLLENGIVAVLMDYIDGQTVNETMLQDEARKAGALLGSIHSATRGYVIPSNQTRTIFSELDRVMQQVKIFESSFEDGAEFLGRVCQYRSLEVDKANKNCIIHNDFRPHNLLKSAQGELFVLDFDWSCYGPAEKDLAHALVEWSMLDGQEEPNTRIWESFVAGYVSITHTTFSSEDIRLWAAFSCLSDTATYLCDKIDNGEELPERIRSYMYKKFKFFQNNETK